MKKSIPFVLIFLLSLICIPAAGADIIPSDRRIDWSQVGVKGDIPIRATVCTTINNATYGNGATDATNAIQTALNNCPSGQVVYLPPGIYKTSGTITVPPNRTLRGAGIGVTTIKNSVSVNYIVGFSNNPDWYFSQSTARDIVAGNAKGSISITTSVPHGWNAGDIILIDQLEDPTGNPPITSTGAEGTCTWCSRNDGTRPAGQIDKVVAVPNATTAVLELPLSKTYDKSPQGIKLSGITSNAGVEDMSLDSSNACVNDNAGIFSAEYSENSWILRVEIKQVCRTGLQMTYTYRNTVRSSIIHETAHHASNGGYLLWMMGANSGNLIEDCIFYNGLTGIIYNGATSGNVIAYNYVTKMWSDDYPGRPGGGTSAHGAHSMMNLFEGNYCDGPIFSGDFTWGTTAYSTYYRNRQITNTYPNSPVNNLYGIQLLQNAWYMNFVGNVLGTSGNETVYESADVYDGRKGIYFLADSGVTNSILRHGNWDSVHNGVVWDSTISDHNIPSSLYLSSKPSWFGSVPWPSTGPDVTGLYSKIPAQLRYEGNYSYLSTQTCSSLGGACCLSSQTCSGSIQSSSDCSYCCIGGTCQNPFCGDGTCNGAETCSSCPGDCLSGGQVCCSGQVYQGNCCSNPDCSSPQVCTNHICATPDLIAPTVSITSPIGGIVSGTITISATANDNVGVAGVQFKVDGNNIGLEDTSSPYSTSWDSTTVANGTHTLTAIARDAAGNTNISQSVIVTVSNQVIQYSGLVAAYSFNEGTGTTAQDYSENNNNGMLVNGPNWTTGKYGNALSFDGIDDMVSVNKDVIGTAAVTISAWVYLRGYNGFIASNGPSQFLTIGWDKKLGFSSDFETNVAISASNSLPLNQWVYVTAMRISSGITNIYINGLLSGSGNQSSGTPLAGNNAAIGNHYDGAYAFNGIIDEVRIYSRTLSKSEIQSDMNTPIGMSCQKSDTNCNSCVEMSELLAFIDRWKLNNLDVTIKELIEAIGLWKRGC